MPLTTIPPCVSSMCATLCGRSRIAGENHGSVPVAVHALGEAAQRGIGGGGIVDGRGVHKTEGRRQQRNHRHSREGGNPFVTSQSGETSHCRIVKTGFPHSRE
jgi:hypothetical protein